MPVRFKRNSALEVFNLTPLIDVVFLLLIFFLVATRFEQEERELDLALAKAIEARPLIAQPEELFVNVTSDGQYYFGGRLLNEDLLLRVLKQYWTRNPGNVRVVIRADKDSRTRHVVAVMNACNQANIRQYSLAAE
jgi:biopolymer transport protein ExbD